jgi:hypothetical protein
MALVVTLAIESLLALFIKLGKLHVIILTNLVSNISMNVILLKLIKGYDLPYILVLMVLELLAIIIEFFVYKHAYKKEQSIKKIFIYTIVANALSCVVFLVLYSGVFRYFAI